MNTPPPAAQEHTMRSMNLHELATRLRDAVAPFATAQDIEDLDDDLFVGEEGIALHMGLDIAAEHRVSLDASLLADLHAARSLFMSEKDQALLDSLTRATA